MEENLEKIEFTQHVLERYVERTMNKTGNEIKQFLVQNEEQVKEQILKLYQYSEPFWYGKNKDHNYTYFRINKNGWLIVVDRNKTKLITLYKIDLGLGEEFNKQYISEMKKLVEAENLHIAKVVPVLAQDMDFDEEYIARAYGLDKLIDVMSEVLPSELQNTLQNVQKASLESKKRAAHAAVATAVAAAFGEGFSPIPFSDAALLVPTQVGMIAGITVIFGMDISKSFLTGFTSATIGSAGMTVLGKTIVSNLIKLIPGIGTATGGMISGTTAGLLTTALGEAYILIMEMIYKGDMKKEDLFTEEGQKEMTRLFKDQLKKAK